MRQRRPYVNHEKARRVLKSALSSDGPHLVTVHAKGGKGKSTLLKWIEDQCRAQSISCAAVTFRELKGCDGFQVLDALARKMPECKFERYQLKVREYLGSSGASVTFQNVNMENSQVSGIQAISADPVRRRYILSQLSAAWFQDVRDFAGTDDASRVVLMLDTIEAAGDEVKTWVGDILQPLHELTNIVLIVAGQEKVGVDKAHWADCCCELELPDSLEYRFWLEYAKGTGALQWITERALQHYHEVFGGDPLRMVEICDLETQ